MTAKERREAQRKAEAEYRVMIAKIARTTEVERVRLKLYEVDLIIKSYEHTAERYTTDSEPGFYQEILNKLLDLQIERLRIQGQLHAVERHSFDFNSFSLTEQAQVIDELKKVTRSDVAK